MKEKKTLLRQKAEEILSKKIDSSAEPSIKTYKTLIHELQVHQIEIQMQNDELKSTHKKLEKNKQRYLDLYNKAPVGYFELNNKLIIQEVNEIGSRLLNLSHNDVINNAITKFIFKDDQDTFYLFQKKFHIIDEQHSCELRMLNSDGNTSWALLEVSLDKDDISNGVLRLVVHDISDRKKYEEELKLKDEVLIIQERQAAMGEMLIVKARQAAMGEIITMIAHQWRQPITTIGMTANNIILDIALNKKITSKELEAYCNDIQVQVNYLSRTIDDFKEFLNYDIQKESLSICDVMDITLNMVQKSLENNNIKVETDYNCRDNIEIVQSELKQVLINIINNAKDSLLENSIENPVISIKIYEDKDFTNIEISDNGNGIPADILPKLGEPYISSKSKNTTGLGIYMSKTIIEKHMQGILKWKNLDKGACFTILLRKKTVK